MSKINTKIMSATPEAVKRLEHLINESEKDIKAIKIGVENGGCAGMAYIMEYAKEKKPNDEMIEDKGVKVFIDLQLLCICWVHKWIIKKINFHHPSYSITQMKQRDVGAESPLKYSIHFEHISFA